MFLIGGEVLRLMPTTLLSSISITHPDIPFERFAMLSRQSGACEISIDCKPVSPHYSPLYQG